MTQPDSRANRRRRWWLRAQAALSRWDYPGLRSETLPPATTYVAETDWDYWRTASAIPPGVQFELDDRWSGQRLVLPLCEPRLVIGHGVGCDVQIESPRLAPRELALIWLFGELYRIDLTTSARRWHDAVHRVSVDDSWNWGRWSARIRGSLRNPSEQPDHLADLQLELEWSLGGQTETSQIDRNVTWIGSARDCEVRLSWHDAAPIQGMLLRTPRALLAISLSDDLPFCVNDRRIICARLDAGDVLTLGQSRARVTMSWKAGAPAVLTGAETIHRTRSQIAASRNTSHPLPSGDHDGVPEQPPVLPQAQRPADSVAR
ncbi:hypothetical protein GC163_06775 [bacterium]|nr:hypothetical protein [bacterium]